MNPVITFCSSVVIVLLSSFAHAQDFDVLDINNIKAGFNSNGYLFWDEANNTRTFEVPKDSGTHALYAGGLWIGGLEGNGDVVAAFDPYNQSPTWSVGPVMTNATVTPAAYDRLWKVEKSEIDYHIGVTTGAINDPNYVVPASLLDWPAHGDIALGMAFYLAPFADVNMNGLYDPANGDYPEIRGDQCIYLIFNNYHSPFPERTGVEIHAMFYEYSCVNDAALENTVFGSYRIINRTGQLYTNMWVGMWTEGSLGADGDDYIASDVGRGTFYYYNGDNYDQSNSFGQGYEDHPPAQAVSILAGPLQDADGVDNAVGISSGESLNGVGYGDGIVDNERLGMMRAMTYARSSGSNSNVTDPNVALDAYNYLRGIWKDGTNLLYGGNGHLTGSTTNVPAWFFYPHDTDPLGWGTGGVPQGPWTEEDSGNLPDHRRGLVSSGPFTFPAAGETELDVAFIFGQDFSDTTSAAGVQVMKDRVDNIRNYYSAGASCATLSISDEAPKLNAQVYPNPMQDQLTIDFQQEGQATYQLFNLLGELVLEGQITYGKNSISTSNLNTGVYLIRIEQGQTQMTKKLLKQ